MPCLSRDNSNARTAQAAFTLVELLVSIAILVILASATLYGMASVQRNAQIHRAQSQIARIHELIMTEWESYETRRVNIDFAEIRDSLQAHASPPYNDPRTFPVLLERFRVQALRELMRRELPDRATDIFFISSSSAPPRMDFDYVLSSPYNLPPAVRLPLPTASRYYGIFVQRSPRNPNAPIDPNDPRPPWAKSNESAECLYMILSRINVGDATALEFFADDEIGDTDNDGLPELLDPWGNPIRFVRWPAGLTSFVQDRNAETRRDSFDPAGVWDDLSSPQDGFYLMPLIFSSGPDGEVGVVINPTNPTSFSPYNNPYAFFGGKQLGELRNSQGALDPTPASDNITNHFLQSGGG